ncbi:hypothetical protein [Coraliomargarita akajimensis]|uniref:Uncharacterized protein n=1 Tax=Coraliomargarita akajimensis (strain DSM 45221 / IAM 15411 / JCM 23193 / KCTC 12865 / 04OKA010-24) TaxID=583355 RepID=D5EIL3_CORAD|nr:hypothetical protein [Coraliomargarita akajimensis]ADE56134.1 hypothetical protein Caka_3121 [Coraliomargarita akajimensis DSM 45221]
MITRVYNSSSLIGGVFFTALFGTIVFCSICCMPLAAVEPAAGSAEPPVVERTEVAEGSSQKPMDIAVALLETKIIVPPPMIDARDLEAITGIRNMGEAPFGFSYLRAVYYANGEAQSTTIYLNAHFESIQKELGNAREKEMIQDPNHDPSQIGEVFVSGDHPTEEPVVAPEDQYTIAGYPFAGDYYDAKYIKSLRPSHEFEIAPAEVYVISTESAGTHMGNSFRFKDRALLLEFLDAEAELIGQVRVAID